MLASLINETIGVQKSTIEGLKVGMGASMYVGSDIYAMVITEIIGPKEIRLAHMEDQDIEYLHKDKEGNEFLDHSKMHKYTEVTETTIVPSGKIYKLRKNERWVEKGRGLWETGGVHIGHAENYRDPSF